MYKVQRVVGILINSLDSCRMLLTSNVIFHKVASCMNAEIRLLHSNKRI